MKLIVCFSGGHSSAISAIETVRKYGKKNVVLLNHDISSKVEHWDIKRFKNEVAEYLKLPITYANAEGFENMTPLQVSVKASGFNIGSQRTQICTNRLKTAPFMDYLKSERVGSDSLLVYGFDASEPARMQRRAQIMYAQGYKTHFPLIQEERTIFETEEVGIAKPITYKIFKHANCTGCLKAGRRHWYIAYCLRPDIFEEAIWAEKQIGYSILKKGFMKDFIPEFNEIKAKGICPSEKGHSATFWARVRRAIPSEEGILPCDCAI